MVQDLLVSDYRCQAAFDAPGLEAVAEHLWEDQRTLQEESRLAEKAELLTMVEACVQQLAAVAETVGWRYRPEEGSYPLETHHSAFPTLTSCSMDHHLKVAVSQPMMVDDQTAEMA